MKYLIIISAMLICTSVKAQIVNGQVDVAIKDVLFIVDSVQIDRAIVNNMNPNDIASLTVFKGASAINLYGEQAKNGVIVIETKALARAKYLTYLKSKSKEYAAIVTTPTTDSSFQYILNGKPLTENVAGELSYINDLTFKSLNIITQEELMLKFKIDHKKYGVLITTDQSTLE